MSMPNATIPFHHPSRPASEFRPLKAWHHFRKLIADKEDTEQVFHIIAALRGGDEDAAGEGLVADAWVKFDFDFRGGGVGKVSPEQQQDGRANCFRAAIVG